MFRIFSPLLVSGWFEPRVDTGDVFIATRMDGEVVETKLSATFVPVGTDDIRLTNPCHNSFIPRSQRSVARQLFN